MFTYHNYESSEIFTFMIVKSKFSYYFCQVFNVTLKITLGPVNHVGIWKNALRCLKCMNMQTHCFVLVNKN